MDSFHGTVHLPGTDKPMDIQLDVDWDKNHVNLIIPDRPSGTEEWDGLMVQHIYHEELVFRTKGLPGALAHWWHFFHTRSGGLYGIILTLPDWEGKWLHCLANLDRGELVRD